MTRQEAITQIEHLYPADSQFGSTAAIGRKLLQQARDEYNVDWRYEATHVLIRYAELCKIFTLGV